MAKKAIVTSFNPRRKTGVVLVKIGEGKGECFPFGGSQIDESLIGYLRACMPVRVKIKEECGEYKVDWMWKKGCQPKFPKKEPAEKKTAMKKQRKKSSSGKSRRPSCARSR